jgi:hypothetical protein
MKTIILFCILKQLVASYMQRQNITTRFLYIFVASETQRIFVKETYNLKQKYGLYKPYIND